MSQQLTPENAGELFRMLRHLLDASSQIEFEWVNIDGRQGKVICLRPDIALYWQADAEGRRHIAVALGGLVLLFRLSTPSSDPLTEDDVVVHYDINGAEISFHLVDFQGAYRRILRFA